ncbi:hypothetical protein J2Y63_006450 [Shinella sp. BE166]|uniref:hypothetical protein n=1 Tax=Shinella sp. BE166 TaxID=3373918 RepID=UPI003EB997D5
MRIVKLVKKLGSKAFLKPEPIPALPPEFAEPPSWFNRNDPVARAPSAPTFLYQSWIPEHTDKLVDLIRADGQLPFQDIGILIDPANKRRRIDALLYAERQPAVYDRMVMHKLAPYRSSAVALVVTLDWIPVMRRLVYGASRLGIPTILVPHESVFAKEDMYYVHPRMGMNVPLCDLVLAWGDTQERIFASRGYPPERIVKVGAPKFDYLANISTPDAKRAVSVLGLDPSRPVMTFAAQPLDSQYNTEVARVAQNKALLHLTSIAKRTNIQLIIRTPPSRDSILDPEVYEEASSSSSIVIDNASLYLLTAEETIAASDILISINSTMLLEAALAGKVAVTAKYVEFDQIWDGLKIPVARTQFELEEIIAKSIVQPETFVGNYDLGWASRSFGIGEFDGRAALRIREVLEQIRSQIFDVQRGYAANRAHLLDRDA